MTDEDRWAQAESVLRGESNPAAMARLRRQRRTLWLVVLVSVLLGGVVTGVIIGLTGGPSSSDSSELPTWQIVLGVTLTVLGFVADVTAVVGIVRSRQWGAAWRSPLQVLTRHQRKDLLAQVRGRTATDPARLALTRHLAEQMIAERRVWLIYPALLLLWAGLTLISPDAFHLALTAVFALMAVIAPLARRQILRAERFLEQHPAPDPGAGGPGA